MTNLKPFDLERALAGDPVVTRDGLKIIEIIALKSEVVFPVVCAVENIKDHVFVMTRNGKYNSHERDHHHDLFMASKTKTYHINIYYQNKFLNDDFSADFTLGSILRNQEEINQELRRVELKFAKTISFEIEE